MHPLYALILRCRSSTVAERLVGVYAGLLTQASFPFRFQIHINPNDDQVDRLSQTLPCLFFLQIAEGEDSDSRRWISRMYEEYRPLGHQLVLVTDQDIDYFDLAIRFEAGNILFHDSIDASTVGALTHRLLGKDFFGFAPFFPHGWDSREYHAILTGRLNLSGLVDRHFNQFQDAIPEHLQHRFHSQLNELLTNAISYGILGITAEQRDANIMHVPDIVDLPPGREIRISMVRDDEKYGISVRDPGGALTLLRIMQKLQRHTLLPGQELPSGIGDLTGRGLFIVSRQTRIVVNILHGIQTEVILLGYFDEEKNRYKSLIINEKSPEPQKPFSEP